LTDLPIPEGAIANYCTFAANGNSYFSMSADGDSEIYRCVYIAGHFLPPEKIAFNSKAFIDFDPMIASDESFIIFSSNNRKGLGSTDLWICYQKDGQWTEPVNLGPQVNTSGADGSAGLSRDNRTLYFSSSRELISPSEREKPANTQTILQQLHGYKNGLRTIYEIPVSALGSNDF
jgi:Tol biopolymer transport system component